MAAVAKTLIYSLKQFLYRHPYLLLLAVFYFSLRLYNLTILPIFNDESIYLNWGWQETHIAGMAYYSLFDAKPPFLMDNFGFGIIFSMLASEISPKPLQVGQAP